MKFITTDNGNDTQTFATIENGVRKYFENKFIFSGFVNSLHPYHRNRLKWLSGILYSKGIILNIAEVSRVEHMTNSDDYDEFQYSDLEIPKGFDKVSKDGNTYLLFQDTEMGRGWALLIKNNEILMQDHRDIIMDKIEQGDFIRSFGIDYQYLYF